MNGLPVIPRPKQIICGAGRSVPVRQVTVTGNTAVAKRIAGHVARALGTATAGGIRTSAAKAAGAGQVRIILEQVHGLKGVPDQKEGYRLAIQPQQITLRAVTPAGLLHAGQSLLDCLEREGRAWNVPACEITDWPDFSLRGVLVDPARKFIPMPKMLNYIDDMARNKMNVFHVHFTDNEGFTIQNRRWPALNERPYHPMFFRMPRGMFTLKELGRLEADYAGVYSLGDVKQLVAYGRERGVHILPEVSMPSHCAPILRIFPELKCRVDKGATSETVMCIGNEKTYEVMEQLIDDIAPLFPYGVFCLGMDEIECRDVLYNGRMFYSQRWDDCKVCRAAMKRKGYGNVRALFYDFVRRMRKHLARHGKRLTIYNDYIDIAKPVPLPKDILIYFWQIALKNRGPRTGCSFAKFLKAGFQIMNINSLDTYIDEHQLMKEKKLVRWSPTSRPHSPPELMHLVAGGELNVWNDHPEHYPRTVPPGMAVFADRLWNKAAIADIPLFSRRLARHLFGPTFTGDLANVFEKFGGMISPRSAERLIARDEMTMPETAMRTKAECRELERGLRRDLARGTAANRRLIEELIENSRAMEKSLP